MNLRQMPHQIRNDDKILGLGPQVIVSSNKLENMNLIIQAEEGRGAIFLGDIISVRKEELLRKHSIKAIISCGFEAVYDPLLTSGHKVQSHKTIPAHDLYTYDMSQHFSEANDFIERQLNKGHNVLVHCHAGVSRSATILAAYLMHKKGFTADEAVALIREKRRRAKPNDSFLKQLRQYEPCVMKRDKLTQEKTDTSTPTKQTEIVEYGVTETPPKKQECVEIEEKVSKTEQKEEKNGESWRDRLARIEQMIQESKKILETPKKSEEIQSVLAQKAVTPIKLEERVMSNRSYRQPPMSSYPRDVKTLKASVVKEKSSIDSQFMDKYEIQRQKAVASFFSDSHKTVTPTRQQFSNGYKSIKSTTPFNYSPAHYTQGPLVTGPAFISHPTIRYSQDPMARTDPYMKQNRMSYNY